MGSAQILISKKWVPYVLNHVQTPYKFIGLFLICHGAQIQPGIIQIRFQSSEKDRPTQFFATKTMVTKEGHRRLQNRILETKC